MGLDCWHLLLLCRSSPGEAQGAAQQLSNPLNECDAFVVGHTCDDADQYLEGTDSATMTYKGGYDSGFAAGRSGARGGGGAGALVQDGAWRLSRLGPVAPCPAPDGMSSLFLMDVKCGCVLVVLLGRVLEGQNWGNTMKAKNMPE
ncbi:hypothetical protein T484DRAFT_1782183 [Baffinella frigidus]|nr:hypothetical protein T484DRAFT_1782183 [Cryptophyta sp. CCMP2293]